MISQKEFFNLYNRNSPFNKNRDKGAWDARLFLRDISHPFAYSAAKLKISANTITILMLLVMLLGNLVFVFDGIFSLLIFVFLHEFAQVLDCVDGQLARYYGSTSEMGRVLDSLIHSLVASSFIFAFGVRIYLESSNAIYILLGGIGAIGYVFDMKWMEILEQDENSEESKSISETKTFSESIKGVLTIFDDMPLLACIAMVLSFLSTKMGVLNLLPFVFGLDLFYIYLKLAYRIKVLLTYTGVKNRVIWKGWR